MLTQAISGDLIAGDGFVVFARGARPIGGPKIGGPKRGLDVGQDRPAPRRGALHAPPVGLPTPYRDVSSAKTTPAETFDHRAGVRRWVYAVK